MTDFLTRRNGTWHFVRRVPTEFSAVDRRGIVRHSTKIKIADDRLGRRAARVAQTLNDELERFWRSLAGEQHVTNSNAYDQARNRARSLGFDFIENNQLLLQPIERILERLETLVERGLVNDAGARKAVLGTAERTGFLLSTLFTEYEAATKDETKDLSPDQLRIWRNGRMRAVENFVRLIGDKPVTEITDSDGMDYAEWWRERVINDEVTAKTANKDIGQLSGMLKAMSTRRRLALPEIFKGLQLKGEIEKSRMPFDPDFIQRRLLGGALDTLNEDARLVMFVMMETGMRPPEIVNLQRGTIILGASVPHVRIIADGRRLKTDGSEREIPLVGVALEALKMRPKGFPKYRDKATALSATINKYMTENGLRPSSDHTLYSLRHSFKDRLISVEAPDSLIDSLMGHRTPQPRYGRGPSLELKLKFLERIAFVPPKLL
jgi:integrase